MTQSISNRTMQITKLATSLRQCFRSAITRLTSKQRDILIVRDPATGERFPVHCPLKMTAGQASNTITTTARHCDRPFFQTFFGAR